MLICEQTQFDDSLREEALSTIRALSRCVDLRPHLPKVIHPCIRIVFSPSSSRELLDATVRTILTVLLHCQELAPAFLPSLDKALHFLHVTRTIEFPKYEEALSLIRSGSYTSQSFHVLDAQDLPQSLGVELIEDIQVITSTKLAMSQRNLKRVWEVSQRSTKEDWQDWMRRFSMELLKESPSPALRACAALAQTYYPLAADLFQSSFLSCWSELHPQYQADLISAMENVFLSSSSPPEVLQPLLDLAEFMERNDKPLPVAAAMLSDLAERCHAYARALYYRESEFRTSATVNSTMIDALIRIHNQLQQPESAVGLLDYLAKTAPSGSFQIKASWYEKLQKWEEALASYEQGQNQHPESADALLGRMRCLKGLYEWEKLHHLTERIWYRARTNKWLKQEIAPLAAEAAWNLGLWSSMEESLSVIALDKVEGAFLRAIAFVQKKDFESASSMIEKSRTLIDKDLTALLREDYKRAYKYVVTTQQLSELEEISSFFKSQSDNAHVDSVRKSVLGKCWRARLDGCKPDVEVWQRILSVRNLVSSAKDDIFTWLKFSSLCRKSGRLNLSYRTLTTLLGNPSTDEDLPHSYPMIHVTYAFLKHLWSAGFKSRALERLRVLVSASDVNQQVLLKESHDPSLREIGLDICNLISRCCVTLADWKRSDDPQLKDPLTTEAVINALSRATELEPESYRAWHAWAFVHYQLCTSDESSETELKSVSGASRPSEMKHVITAIQGFFKSITLGGEVGLQDNLRLLYLWFKFGSDFDVDSVLRQGFETVSIDTWLSAIPQIVARLHTSQESIRLQLHDLLCKIGQVHPQSLVYPLTVASQSLSLARKAAASQILSQLKQHSPILVEQASLVSQELIRVAILWHEMWNEALDEASRLYFGAKNIEAMIATLAPLHEMMARGAQTLREVSFQQSFGKDLKDAQLLCQNYLRTRKEIELTQAWEIYCHVFSRISQQLRQLTDLELQQVSPNLMAARDLELVIPGMYAAGQQIVTISFFHPTLRVIDSKQRPRRLVIRGSDGKDYTYVLKGHEDLRQDERVMQLFGLVNALFQSEPSTASNSFSIMRYSAIPLSPNSGLIEWLEDCDTMHALIKEYRDARRILLNIEQKLMVDMSKNHQSLTLIQKLEVFQHVLSCTTGIDLAKVLWLKSDSSETWLSRRGNYIRSVAVMSMVGYVLGLGDRHPCNIMIHRTSGKIAHIDFGDCFEVAMQREKYPEKIPFRLTRMMIRAMDISGIEGSFKTTCERVMKVIRSNKDSIMAVLEAFIHDPLVNWKLAKIDALPGSGMNEGLSDSLSKFGVDLDIKSGEGEELLGTSVKDAKSITRSYSMLGQRAIDSEVPSEVLNARAVKVISRVWNKLTGTDFDACTALDIKSQVCRLVHESTSAENLSQSYVGWCPFW